jgi:hypothetical protein
MISEWMKVMLEEIARKRTEAQQARAEEQQRREELDLESRQSNNRGAAE